MTDSSLGRRALLAALGSGPTLAMAGCSDDASPTIQADDVRVGDADDRLLVRWNAAVFEEPVTYEGGRWTLSPQRNELPCYVTFEAENAGDRPIDALPRFGLEADGDWHQLHPFAPGATGVVADGDDLEVGATVVRERVGTVPGDAAVATFGPVVGGYGPAVGLVEYRREPNRGIPWRTREQ